MRLCYHQIVGMRVVDAEGKPAGHVMDLRAAADGDTFRVNALLIAPRSFLHRLGLTWPHRAGQTGTKEVPWEAVARVADQVYLRIRAAEIEAPKMKPVPRPGVEDTQ
jgi:sporulation protein YlmC with PRC-barrel domain